MHNGLTSGQVQAIVGHLAPLNYVRIHRIALFARICRSASPVVMTLLHFTFTSPRSWIRAVLEDLEFVSTCSIKCRGMSSMSMVEWVRFFRNRGKPGVDAIRAGIAESCCNRPLRLTLPHHEHCEEQYICNVCGDIWPTLQRLAVHLAKAHNRAHDIRRFLPYGVTHCQVCLLEKHTRAGIVEHLADKRNNACAANLMLRVQPVGLRQSRLWDEMGSGEPGRRKHGRIPAYRHIGPPLFVVGVAKQHHKNGIKHMAL